jgi:hypothetical protein
VTDRAPLWLGLAGVAVAALVVVPLVVDEDEGAAGFESFVQSGTCAEPSDDFVVDLENEEESDDDGHDVEPYVAVGRDGEPVTLGYYGASEIPGFSVALLYTDERFSMVVTDPDSGEAVACGDLLEPDDDRFGEEGLAVVQLVPVGSSDIQGVATLERTRLERELDITPTRARILLSAEATDVPTAAVEGYEAFVQDGTCDAPGEDLLLDLESEDDHDIAPFEARSDDSADPVTVAYYGAAGVPGFGLAAAYTEQEFSLIVTDPGADDPVACGEILVPDDDRYEEAGLALVQLLPTGDDGPQGYALIDRRGMERELDVTPTVIRVVLFAPPVASA